MAGANLPLMARVVAEKGPRDKGGLMGFPMCLSNSKVQLEGWGGGG